MVLTRSSYSRLGTPLASPLINNPNNRRKRLSLASSSTTPPGTPSRESFSQELTSRLASHLTPNQLGRPDPTTDERQCSLLSQSQTLPYSSSSIIEPNTSSQPTIMNDLPQNNSLQIIESNSHQNTELESMIDISQEDQLSNEIEGEHSPENHALENQSPEKKLEQSQERVVEQLPEKEVKLSAENQVNRLQENGVDSLTENKVEQSPEEEVSQSPEKEVEILQEVIVLDSEEEEEIQEIREEKKKVTHEIEEAEPNISKEQKTSESTIKNDQELTEIVVEPSTDPSSSVNPSITEPLIPNNHELQHCSTSSSSVTLLASPDVSIDVPDIVPHISIDDQIVLEVDHDFQPINDQEPTSSNELVPIPSPNKSTLNPLEPELESDSESDSDSLKELLKRAKSKARLIDLKTNSISRTDEAEGNEEDDDDGRSSVTLQNMIRVQGGPSSKPLKNPLHHPLRISNALQTKTETRINADNLDRVSFIKDQKLGYTNLNSRKKVPVDWHDLPVQELTKENKIEIQAMRLHRTLDPKSFVKGGIDKTLNEPLPTKFLFGHIIDGTSSSSSSKKRTFVESLIHDQKSTEWSKKKFNQIQTSTGKNSGGKNFYKNVQQNRAR